ncbi:transposable element Tc1 transposase [Trichonephila clavipes]|nr:transposable element Tc1 transposase [Trichonephila clavipes]
MLHSQLYGNILGKAHFSSSRVTAPFTTHQGLHRQGLTKWVFKNWTGLLRAPYLNPIEHLWDEIEHRLHSQPNRLSSLQALTSAVMDAWRAIPMVTYQKLVESLPKRVQAVIHAKEGPTSY